MVLILEHKLFFSQETSELLAITLIVGVAKLLQVTSWKLRTLRKGRLLLDQVEIYNCS